MQYATFVNWIILESVSFYVGGRTQDRCWYASEKEDWGILSKEYKEQLGQFSEGWIKWFQGVRINKISGEKGVLDCDVDSLVVQWSWVSHALTGLPGVECMRIAAVRWLADRTTSLALYELCWRQTARPSREQRRVKILHSMLIVEGYEAQG
jgi:hypothetical protein